MQQAYRQAKRAYDEDEIPVGAVVVKNNRIIGKGYNQTEQLNDATAHAEMLAVSAACSTLEEKYLTDCTLYVTLEPCVMCAGALVWSKIDTLVFGAQDANAGGCGSAFNLSSNDKLNHQVDVIHGIMEKECEDLLGSFFKNVRRNT